MFEAETAWLLEMRLRARGEAVVLAQVDQALSIVCRLGACEADGDLDELEVAIETLASLVGLNTVRH